MRNSFKLAIVAISAVLSGCCPPTNPNTNEVQAWVASELPKASSAEDVRRFAQSHAFSYDYSTETSAQLSREVNGGCPGSRPVVIINVEFDRQDHVKSLKVWGAAMPP
ncbi:MAG TPA: hypothetical protein VH370_11100 [Humisphaera sp.]|jgi:hypothetical protein|nr:hypothetical protein [Humisphaera sp.]